MNFQVILGRVKLPQIAKNRFRNFNGNNHLLHYSIPHRVEFMQFITIPKKSSAVADSVDNDSRHKISRSFIEYFGISSNSHLVGATRLRPHKSNDLGSHLL